MGGCSRPEHENSVRTTDVVVLSPLILSMEEVAVIHSIISSHDMHSTLPPFVLPREKRVRSKMDVAALSECAIDSLLLYSHHPYPCSFSPACRPWMAVRAATRRALARARSDVGAAADRLERALAAGPERKQLRSGAGSAAGPSPPRRMPTRSLGVGLSLAPADDDDGGGEGKAAAEEEGDEDQQRLEDAFADFGIDESNSQSDDEQQAADAAADGPVHEAEDVEDEKKAVAQRQEVVLQRCSTAGRGDGHTRWCSQPRRLMCWTGTLESASTSASNS